MSWFGPSREVLRELASTRSLAEDAKSVADRIATKHEGHERLCTERWEQSRLAATATMHSVEELSKTVARIEENRSRETKALNQKIIWTLLGAMGSLLVGGGGIVFELLRAHL